MSVLSGVGDVEPEEARGGMEPPVRLHNIREQGNDTVRTWREGSGLALHDGVDVNTLLFGLFLFEVTERVPEPPHDKPTIKTDPLHHPLARSDVAEGAETGQGVDEWPVEQHCLLPEAAADDGEAAGSRGPHADQGKLCVGATNDHRVSLPLGRSRRRSVPGRRR